MRICAGAPLDVFFVSEPTDESRGIKGQHRHFIASLDQKVKTL